MSEPKWGEPGYRPMQLRPELSRGHKRALWAALALGLAGQVAYLWALFSGATDINGDGCIDASEPMYAPPWLALAGFLTAVVALALAIVVMLRSRPRPPLRLPEIALVIPILTAINIGLMWLLPLGGGCW